MADMLQAGQEWLANQLKTHASNTVVYVRGGVALREVEGNFAEQPAEVVHQHRKRLIYTSTNEPQSR